MTLGTILFILKQNDTYTFSNTQSQMLNPAFRFAFNHTPRNQYGQPIFVGCFKRKTYVFLILILYNLKRDLFFI